MNVAAIRARMVLADMSGFPFVVAAGRSGLLMPGCTTANIQGRGFSASFAWRQTRGRNTYTVRFRDVAGHVGGCKPCARSSSDGDFCMSMFLTYRRVVI